MPWDYRYGKAAVAANGSAEPKAAGAACSPNGRYAQGADIAKLGRTITDHTYLMGDQCQSFVASLYLDPVKLI
jgi:hypothetical protein